MLKKLKAYLKDLRDRYVVNQAQVTLPEFAPDRAVRYAVTFSGRVQHVGFRLELSELGKRLGLTGFCENLPEGDVYAEIQGPENRIRFLLDFMESLIRIHITGKTMILLPTVRDESSFAIR